MSFTIELCTEHSMIKGLQSWFRVAPDFIQIIKDKTDNWEHEDCDMCNLHTMVQNKVRKLQKENQEWIRLRKEQEWKTKAQ